MVPVVTVKDWLETEPYRHTNPQAVRVKLSWSTCSTTLLSSLNGGTCCPWRRNHTGIPFTHPFIHSLEWTGRQLFSFIIHLLVGRPGNKNIICNVQRHGRLRSERLQGSEDRAQDYTVVAGEPDVDSLFRRLVR